MNIYPNEFYPTYLYIKQHKITGLLYFGKTTGTEQYLLETYKGGGKYWNKHLRKHSNEHVETIWYCLFTEKDELVKFALQCSEQWDIVKSKEWANEKPENGLDGMPTGYKHSQETKDKISKAGTGKVISESQRQKVSIANTGRKQTEFQKQCSSQLHSGKILSQETKDKISNSKTGKLPSAKQLAVYESMKSKTPWNKGKSMSAEQKEKLSIAAKRHRLQNLTPSLGVKLHLTVC